ncbi:hypothetical protein M1L60_33610 [Actinoplanes sp. TRM 88003]|uniref:Lipoprotein n=1 Tax=Paractinoplanes aksuensis TaxID=2939490 RepID=A0ABT1DY64_9ACTN|nr:hypothetical protein [Actinoplanes aksuensis]MCO8275533.1 hypothetical protein [Actinoplanes aksuensis]
MRKSIVVTGAVALVALGACGDAKTEEPAARPASSAAAPAEGGAEVRVQTTALGDILTDQSGRTLYAFTPDKEGFGSCQEDCTAVWPPYLAEAQTKAGPGVDAAKLTAIEREGDVAQVKYGDWPLYYYVADLGAGDVDGQGDEDGQWWAVDVDGKLVKKMPNA